MIVFPDELLGVKLPNPPPIGIKLSTMGIKSYNTQANWFNQQFFLLDSHGATRINVQHENNLLLDQIMHFFCLLHDVLLERLHARTSV